MFVWVGWVSSTRFWGIASVVTVLGALAWVALVGAAALKGPSPPSIIPSLLLGSLLGLTSGWVGGSRDARRIESKLRSEAIVVRTWRDPHVAVTLAYMIGLILAAVSVLIRVPEVALASVSFLGCDLACGSVFRFEGLRRAQREMGPIEIGRGIPGIAETGFAYRVKRETGTP